MKAVIVFAVFSAGSGASVPVPTNILNQAKWCSPTDPSIVVDWLDGTTPFAPSQPLIDDFSITGDGVCGVALGAPKILKLSCADNFTTNDTLCPALCAPADDGTQAWTNTDPMVPDCCFLDLSGYTPAPGALTFPLPISCTSDAESALANTSAALNESTAALEQCEAPCTVPAPYCVDGAAAEGYTLAGVTGCEVPNGGSFSIGCAAGFTNGENNNTAANTTAATRRQAGDDGADEDGGKTEGGSGCPGGFICNGDGSCTQKINGQTHPKKTCALGTEKGFTCSGGALSPAPTLTCVSVDSVVADDNASSVLADVNSSEEYDIILAALLETDPTVAGALIAGVCSDACEAADADPITACQEVAEATGFTIECTNCLDCIDSQGTARSARQGGPGGVGAICQAGTLTQQWQCFEALVCRGIIAPTQLCVINLVSQPCPVCPGSKSKKGLLGLLGLLGLIPLLLCSSLLCCLLWLCCIRKKKTEGDVLFATFGQPAAVPMVLSTHCEPIHHPTFQHTAVLGAPHGLCGVPPAF